MIEGRWQTQQLSHGKQPSQSPRSGKRKQHRQGGVRSWAKSKQAKKLTKNGSAHQNNNLHGQAGRIAGRGFSSHAMVGSRLSRQWLTRRNAIQCVVLSVVGPESEPESGPPSMQQICRRDGTVGTDWVTCRPIGCGI